MGSRAVVVVMVALVASLVVVGRASARHYTLHQFHTPDHNTFCVYGQGYMRCQLHHLDHVPKRKPDCQPNYGHDFALDHIVGSRRLCTGEAPLLWGGRRLRYYHHYRYGPFTCQVTHRLGLRCIDRKTKHGMTLSRAHQHLF